MPPDFPELARREARHDGCPNQFDYGTNYHQTAEWLSKSAGWTLDDAKARRVEAEAAIRAEIAALEAASEVEKPAAAEALEVAKVSGIKVAAATKLILESDGLSGAITRAATKLVEYHGKVGYDALGNVPKNATMAAIESKALRSTQGRARWCSTSRSISSDRLWPRRTSRAGRRWAAIHLRLLRHGQVHQVCRAGRHVQLQGPPGLPPLHRPLQRPPAC